MYRVEWLALLLVSIASGQSSLPPPMQVVEGASYSGEQIQERVETGSDGNRVTRSLGSIRLYRDSRGRTRTERPAGIEINDPVAGLRYTLDPQTKTAKRVKVPRELIIPGDGPGGVITISTGAAFGFAPPEPGAPIAGVLTVGAPGAAAPQLSTEDLGTLTLEGVLVEGTRQTVTIPAGAQGNDRPVVTVSDTWTSPELKIAMLSKVTDPRTGERTSRITHLSRAEPALTLFQPPADYRIVDIPPGSPAAVP